MALSPKLVTDDKYWAALVGLMSKASTIDAVGHTDVSERLHAQAAAGPYKTLEANVSDEIAPGPHGPVPVRVYHPVSPGKGRPLFVWCHGGGWASGDLDMPEADATAREVCKRADAVVVSVNYRLAVRGVHYPVPLDDVVAAYRWAVAEAVRLGATSDRATLGGASAGANLAAGACLRLRAEGVLPSALLLVYPLVHPELPAPSQELAEKLVPLPPAAAAAPEILTPLVENYLGSPTSEAISHAMPGLADLAELAGLPPTLIINCEYDGLRASGEAFANSLAEAGVKVKQLLAPDCLHGHINSPWLPQAQQSYADMASWVLRSA
jgi:acetyl esterase